ncbi:hypothetical protein PSENEW3_00005731 [Picochlorum sp. SENEW3]|nr:hypothetical protein PSENEW3_00005731 [Picochlorum sp. SENEW3]
MLGNELYQNPAVGDYDPESPRPNSMTGTTGPSSVVPGTGESHGMDFGAPPPPPPPPMMGFPGQFMGRQGMSKIPGPGSASSTGGGVAPPMWPPSKVPTMMGKPPRAAPSMQQQDVQVSRTSSLQSGSWNTRSSFDAPPGVPGNVGPPVANVSEVGEPPRFDQPVSQTVESAQDVFDSQQYSNQEQYLLHEEQHYVHEEQQYMHEEQQYAHQEHHWDDNNNREMFNVREHHTGYDGQGSHLPGDASQGTSHRPTKMPPPAIAKESPLRALYAKGTEGYEKHRKKITLNMSLDAVAHTNRVPAMAERDKEAPSVDVASMHSNDQESAQQTNAPPLFPMPHAGSHEVLGYQQPASHEPTRFDGHQGPQAFEPPSQFMGGESTMQSNGPPSSQFLEGESQGQALQPPPPSQFMGGEPGIESTGPPSQFVGGESRTQSPETEHEHIKSRPYTKRGKGFFLFRKRVIFLQMLFLTVLVVHPSWIMMHMTVAGALFQSGLTGYALVEPVKFRGMLHSQYPPESSVHPYIETIENCFNMFTQASQSAWDSTESRLTCSSSSIMCRWAKSSVHASLMVGTVSKECTLSFYRSIPGMMKSSMSQTMQVAHATKSVVQSGNLWNLQFLQGWMREKAMNAKDNISLLIHGGKDFAICTARTSFNSRSIVNLSRNIILCWTSSFEEFLKVKQGQEVDVEFQEVMHDEENHYEEEQHLYMDEEDSLNVTEKLPGQGEEEEEKDHNASMAEPDIMEQYLSDTMEPPVPHEVFEPEQYPSHEEYPQHDVNYMADTIYGEELDTRQINDTIEEDTHFDQDSEPLPHEEEKNAEERVNDTKGSNEPEYPTYDGGLPDYEYGLSQDNEEQVPMTDDDVEDVEATLEPPVPVENPESTEEVPLDDNEAVPETREEVPAKDDGDVDNAARDSLKEEKGSDLRAMLESNAPAHDTIDDSAAVQDKETGVNDAEDIKQDEEKEELSASGHHVVEGEQTRGTPQPNDMVLMAQRAMSWVYDTSQALQDKSIHAALLLIDIIDTNKTHILTAVVSALGVSSIFLAQGYLNRNRRGKDILSTPKSVIRVDDMDTPASKAVYDHDADDDEPLTVYKSARSTRPRRSKVSNLHAVDDDDENNELDSVAPRTSRRRASRASTRHAEDEKPTRSSSRTRKARSTSSSRRKKT